MFQVYYFFRNSAKAKRLLNKIACSLRVLWKLLEPGFKITNTESLRLWFLPLCSYVENPISMPGVGTVEAYIYHLYIFIDMSLQKQSICHTPCKPGLNWSLTLWKIKLTELAETDEDLSFEIHENEDTCNHYCWRQKSSIFTCIQGET